MNLSDHAAAEGHLHPMDKQQIGTSECAAARQGDHIADMDSQLIEITQNTVSSFDLSNTAKLSEWKLG